MKLKIIITVSILILLVTLLIFLFIFSCKDIRVNNKAVEAFNSGDFEFASENFNKEILKQPSNYNMLNNAAVAEYKLNKFGNAKLKHNTVINSPYSHKEEKFIALYDLGNIEYMEGNFQKAVDLYKEALKLVPDDKDAKYNLEAALLKLNEKKRSQINNMDNNQDKQRNESNKQNNSDKQTNKEEQDLKKQMDQNKKAQKENEEKSSETNKSAEKNEGKSQSQQKDLDKEKQNLEKQRQEISEKIKALKDKKRSEKKISKDNAEARENESQKDKHVESFEASLQEKNDNKKDMQSAMFLSYYNELDKKADKLRNKNKNPLLSQPKEDW